MFSPIRHPCVQRIAQMVRRGATTTDGALVYCGEAERRLASVMTQRLDCPTSCSATTNSESIHEYLGSSSTEHKSHFDEINQVTHNRQTSRAPQSCRNRRIRRQSFSRRSRVPAECLYQGFLAQTACYVCQAEQQARIGFPRQSTVTIRRPAIQRMAKGQA